MSFENVTIGEAAEHLARDIPEIIADNTGVLQGEHPVYDVVTTSAPTAMLDTLMRNGVTDLDVSGYPSESAEERTSAILQEGYAVMQSRSIPAPNLAHYDQAMALSSQNEAISLQDAIAAVEQADPTGVPQPCGTPVEAPDGSTYYLPDGYTSFSGGMGPNAGHHYMSGPDGLVYTPYYAPIALDGYDKMQESLDAMNDVLTPTSIPAAGLTASASAPVAMLLATPAAVTGILGSVDPIPESVLPPDSSCDASDYGILD